MKTDTGAREPVLILAIETSCDETSVAVVKDGCEVLSNIISSQIETHRAFGGVVPEVASRKHVEVITLVIEEALSVAGVRPQELTAVAVTQGPGLVGALLVGVVAAKSLALAWGKPLIGTHHIAGHIYANRLVKELKYPNMTLVVSGGIQSWCIWSGKEASGSSGAPVTMPSARRTTKWRGPWASLIREGRM